MRPNHSISRDYVSRYAPILPARGEPLVIGVVKGPNSDSLAKLLASRLDAKIIPVYKKVFPDGEIYVRICIDELDEPVNKIVVVASLYPRQNDSIMETLLITNALRNIGYTGVTAVIPYIAYSRQDKIFMEGEPVSFEVILSTLSAMGIRKLVTVDVHSPIALSTYFSGQSINVLVSDLLVKEALKYLENPVVLAPDKGALNRAQYAAGAHGLEYDYLVKHRDRVTGEVSVEPKELSVRDRDVVIVDDIISTGGTIALAARECLRNGARRVVVAVTHSLLVGDALKKIRGAGVFKLVTANTIPIEGDDFIEVVDISGRISDEIKRIMYS